MFNILKNYTKYKIIYHFNYKKISLKKVENIVANLHDKTEYAIHIINLKETLNQELVLKKFQRVIKFNQNSWLKPYIDMSTDLRRKARNDFEKKNFEVDENAAFAKTIENVRKHSGIKLATTERGRNYLVSDPNYHTKKIFTEHLLAIETKKSEILLNKPLHLGLAILELSKVLIYKTKIWFHCMHKNI